VRLSITDPALFETLYAVLERGGVAILPCDTIYGLVGVAPESEACLRDLKGRHEKSFLRLIPTERWLSEFTTSRLPPTLRGFWPGPLTVIFDAKAAASAPEAGQGQGQSVAGELHPRAGQLDGDGPAVTTVALRVPKDAMLVRLMERLERPLFSTSVNPAGKPALWRIADILASFEGRVDLVVDAGDRPGGVPSTILDVTGRPFRVLRRGAVELSPELLA